MGMPSGTDAAQRAGLAGFLFKDLEDSRTATLQVHTDLNTVVSLAPLMLDDP